MILMAYYPIPKNEADVFICTGTDHSRQLTLKTCLMTYLHVNAMAKKKHPCWCCPQGRLYREAHSLPTRLTRPDTRFDPFYKQEQAYDWKPPQKQRPDIHMQKEQKA